MYALWNRRLHLLLIKSNTHCQVPFLANMGDGMGEIRTLFSAEVATSIRTRLLPRPGLETGWQRETTRDPSPAPISRPLHLCARSSGGEETSAWLSACAHWPSGTSDGIGTGCPGVRKGGL